MTHADEGPGLRDRCAAGEWVEVERVLLEPADRSPGLPPETADKALLVWVKGFARSGAALGGEVAVETMSGREVTGRLSAVNPGYTHTFGDPIPQLARVGRDLRARVAAYRAGGGGAGGGVGRAAGGAVGVSGGGAEPGGDSEPGGTGVAR